MKESSDHTTRVQQYFVQHAASVKYFVLSLLPNPAGAEDVVQEVFLTVTAKANDFEEGTNFKAWVFAIARFKVLEHLRQAKREPYRLSEETMELLADEAAGESDTDDLEKEQHLAAALSRCLNKLAPKSRLLIERVYRDGLKPGTVAEEIGWKPNAAYVTLSRARATLRSCIAKQPNTESA
ncbi:MAG: sigma-70 family RNA polymerase sigma factor [Verrucomicrobiales bacterium]|nr:sigma-70 family RNA polymerase sigma factor [Verrucomicrobiales bacterium]